MMSATTDPMATLVLALKTRAASTEALAEASELPRDEVAAALETLEDRGLLRVEGDVITYRSPAATVSEYLRGVLEQTSVHLDQVVNEAQGLLANLPALIHDHSEDGDDVLTADVVRGPWALAEVWRKHSTPTVPSKVWVCMPDTAILAAANIEHEKTFWAARQERDVDIRVLMPVAHIHTAGHLQNEKEAGTQIRLHPDPPSYFWITGDDLVMIPLVWGDPAPTAVMTLKSPALAHVMRWVFDHLWNESSPVGESEAPWDSMLSLMSAGQTMESASRSLGLTSRTGRRRVEAAMRHYGVSGQFALGSVWARDQERHTAGAQPA
ncbi:hypothetical protein LGT39_07555 [Demequina sp. TTPB684]|uniref:TrmB family transcriptional regulator n=1 Tax=unclassified Demequina TaxID=2620311 RepID=UPI001CF1BCE0|nr:MULTISPECIES: hypothetical protein [unclassified Demequina]MCB2412698.1 hypothetical protein [Demequina sp. TTPB684]UPU87663.1 hypothetical protein LGT36_010415 [Demequina sp. TMPB413]